MTNPFTVHNESVEEFDMKKGGKMKTRRVMLLDASPGNRLSQILELNLPGESAPIGVGKQINVQIDEISSIFAGRPRIRGSIVPGK